MHRMMCAVLYHSMLFIAVLNCTLFVYVIAMKFELNDKMTAPCQWKRQFCVTCA